MAWCHQTASYYLNQCWPRPMSSYGIIRPKWVHSLWIQCTRKTFMIHQTFVRWALYILFKFGKSLIRHLGLAISMIRNVPWVRWFSWTLWIWWYSKWLKTTHEILALWAWNVFFILNANILDFQTYLAATNRACLRQPSLGHLPWYSIFKSLAPGSV